MLGTRKGQYFNQSLRECLMSRLEGYFACRCWMMLYVGYTDDVGVIVTARNSELVFQVFNPVMRQVNNSQRRRLTACRLTVQYLTRGDDDEKISYSHRNSPL